MECSYCNGVGSIEQLNTLFCACESPSPFIVDNVPALVCSLCGDKSYSGETLAQLEKVRDYKGPKVKFRAIRVVDFGEIGKKDENSIDILMAGYLEDFSQEPFEFSYGAVPHSLSTISLWGSTGMEALKMMRHSPMLLEDKWDLAPEPSDSPSAIEAGYCTFTMHSARTNPAFKRRESYLTSPRVRSAP